jgi:hypothetical protein
LTLVAAVATTAAVAIAVLSPDDRSARTQASGESAAASSYEASPAALDAADSRTLPPAVSVEDLVNAQARGTPDERELVIVDLLARLMEIDSQAAARFAEVITESHLREVALRVVAQRWAQLDAATATAWAASLADPKERDQAVLNVALELAQSDPPQAIQLLERQFMADIPSGVLEGIVQQWAEKNYAEALAWSETLSPGARRDLVLQRLVFVRANQDPMDAARLADAAFVDSDKRSDALASIALSWGSRDPKSAREWASTLEGHARERVDAELDLLGGTNM